MGRFHRHDDGTSHDHPHEHEHAHSPEPAPGQTPAHEEPSGEHHAEHLGDHSGYETGRERITVLERIFNENDRLAAANRTDFTTHNICAINLMSSPGAGKTTLLRETLQRLTPTVRIGVIVGDIETSLDADRLHGFGAHITLVNTGNGFGGECHLDAPMIRSALPRLPLPNLDLILIENVGNLVCPAEFDVGEHARAMIYAITEGEEKPLKYPVMFRTADLVTINKIDLLPHLDFNLALLHTNLHTINPTAPTIELSAKTGHGIDQWCNWLLTQLATTRDQRDSA